MIETEQATQLPTALFLSGRIGSGSSTVAKLLSQFFEAIHLHKAGEEIKISELSKTENRILAGGKILRAIAGKFYEKQEEKQGKDEKYSMANYEKELIQLKEKDALYLINFLQSNIQSELNEDGGRIDAKKFGAFIKNIGEIKIFDEIVDQLPLMLLKQETDQKNKVVEAQASGFLGEGIEDELFAEMMQLEKYVIERILFTVNENTAAWRVLYREIEGNKLEFGGKALEPELRGKLLNMLDPFKNCTWDGSPNEIDDACEKAAITYEKLVKEDEEVAGWLIEQFRITKKSNEKRAKTDDERLEELYGVSLSKIGEKTKLTINTTNKDLLEVMELVVRMMFPGLNLNEIQPNLLEEIVFG